LPRRSGVARRGIERGLHDIGLESNVLSRIGKAHPVLGVLIGLCDAQQEALDLLRLG